MMIGNLKYITWEEVFGNKFSVKLHWKMLISDDYCLPRLGRTIHDSSRSKEKSTLVVKYDRDYVISYLVAKIILPLGVDKSLLLGLINEAYEKIENNQFSND